MFDPLTLEETLKNQLSDLGGLTREPVSAQVTSSEENPWHPIHMHESDTLIMVYAELPGLRWQDIKFRLQDGLLRVTGERNPAPEDEGSTRQDMRRQFGTFEQDFRVPSGVDAKQIHARFDAGTLRVQIPKPPPRIRVCGRVGTTKHVFARTGVPFLLPSATATPTGFDYPTVLRGSTSHFNVYYDPGLGNAGAAIADGVLASCEAEYNILTGLFFGVAPSSFNIILAAGIGGAFHYGCAGTDLYEDAQINPINVDHSRMLVVAEEVEVFSAAQGAGWDCSASNGEGLSRVLATLMYPGQLNGFATAASWLDSDRPNWVDNNDSTDTNFISIGCSVLFLNWLHYQLKYSWQSIVSAGGSTLADTYYKLTGKKDGWNEFSTQLAAKFPRDTPSGLIDDNPYPLPTQHMATQIAQQETQRAKQPRGEQVKEGKKQPPKAINTGKRELQPTTKSSTA